MTLSRWVVAGLAVAALAAVAAIGSRRPAGGEAALAGALALPATLAAAVPPVASGGLPEGWLAEGWAAYRAAFVRDGRVLDDVNRITHSEGQGYAMLIAALAGDREAFDAIWAWTRRELLVRSDDLAAWRWEEQATPHVTDRNNATDADLLIAWALAEAAARWNEPAYAAQARRMALAVGRRTLLAWGQQTVLLPGAAGFGAAEQPDGPVVNLSYWVFPAFDRLAAIAPEVPWAALRASGLALLREGRFSLVRLPPDWLALKGPTPQPAAGFPARFGYNAIRIPLYLAWTQDGDAETLRPFAGLWNEARGLGPYEIDLSSGAALSTFEGAGYRAVAALAACAADGRPFPASLRHVPVESYYSTTLHILALVAIQQGYPQCL